MLRKSSTRKIGAAQAEFNLAGLSELVIATDKADIVNKHWEVFDTLIRALNFSDHYFLIGTQKESTLYPNCVCHASSFIENQQLL